MFLDILRVGALASFSPLQTVLTVLILTRLVARLRHRGAGRLRHRRAPGVPAGSDRLCGRRGLRADGRHGDRRSRRGPRAAGGLDGRGPGGLCARSDRPRRRHRAAGVVRPLHTRSCRAGGRQPLPASRRTRRLLSSGSGLVLYFSSQGAGKVLGPVLAAHGPSCPGCGRRLDIGDDRSARFGRCLRWLPFDDCLRARNRGCRASNAVGARSTAAHLMNVG